MKLKPNTPSHFKIGRKGRGRKGRGGVIPPKYARVAALVTGVHQLRDGETPSAQAIRKPGMKIKVTKGAFNISRKRLSEEEPLPEDGLLPDEEPLKDEEPLTDEEPLKDEDPLKDEESKDKEPLTEEEPSVKEEPLTKGQAARLKSLLGSLQKPAATKLAPKARPAAVKRMKARPMTARPAAKPTTLAKKRATSSAPTRAPIVIPSLNDLRREFPEADALYFHRCNYTLDAARSEFGRYGESLARAPRGRTRALRTVATMMGRPKTRSLVVPSLVY